MQDLVSDEEDVRQRYKIEKGIRGCLQGGWAFGSWIDVGVICYSLVRVGKRPVV